MEWNVEFHEAFEPEFDELDVQVQDDLLAKVLMLEQFGPHLG
jgi:hypothetical protein